MHKCKIIGTFVAQSRQNTMLNDKNSAVVMGILNCTPDSFFEGSRKQTDKEILNRASEILLEGGTIIDIGAFSTRPGAQEVSEEEELRRMRKALALVRREHPDVTLSIDTYRPSVARMAVEEYGANIINDVSEGGITGIVDTPLNELGEDSAPSIWGRVGDETFPAIFREVARLQVPYILMSVQKDIDSIIANYRKELALLQQLGAKEVILDPGFGFGKDIVEGNFCVLNELHRLREEFPDNTILAGVSRKRMIWHLLGCTAQDVEAMHGTMLVNLVALQNGARILRVHDVKEAVNTVKIWQQTV